MCPYPGSKLICSSISFSVIFRHVATTFRNTAAAGAFDPGAAAKIKVAVNR